MWHIMKTYSAHGINEFVICLGYRGYMIKEYFANYFLHTSDVTFDMSDNTIEVHQNAAEPWKVTLVDTGDGSMTGGRRKRVAKYLGDEDFCFTYGDGGADVNITDLIKFHFNHGKMATITAVKPPGRYGALKLQNGLLRENVNRNTSAAANAATALNLDNGMVHWFTTNLAAANVKMNVVSGAGINTDMAVGDMISVTIMTAVNSTSNFIEQVRVDGVEASAGVTTYWTGGSAPTDGGGSGVDTYAFNLVKTGSGTYDMVANQVKGS